MIEKKLLKFTIKMSDHVLAVRPESACGLAGQAPHCVIACGRLKMCSGLYFVCHDCNVETEEKKGMQFCYTASWVIAQFVKSFFVKAVRSVNRRSIFFQSIVVYFWKSVWSAL